MPRALGHIRDCTCLVRWGVSLAAPVVAVLLALAALTLPPLASADPVAAGGQLYAFGDNLMRQLGNDSSPQSPTPTAVTIPGASGLVTAVAAGAEHSLVITATGQLYAFGYNGWGQLGNTRTYEPCESVLCITGQATPKPVTLPGATGPVAQIAAGSLFSLALTATGQLYAFGDNGAGQLGTATNAGTHAPNPTPTMVLLPGAAGPITQIAAGVAHSLALTATGQLYAFGANRDGQLGSTKNNRTFEPNPTPTQVDLPGALGPITRIAAGGAHSFALTAAGQLYAFGANFYGQLGNTTNNKTLEPNPAPTLVTLPGASGPATQIAAGGEHSLALTSTGQVYAFGKNSYGQLGNATNNRAEAANPTPTQVVLPGASGPVTRVAAGFEHSLALTATGQLYAFGANGWGQLGNTTITGEPNPVPTPVALPAGAIAKTIASGAGASHSLVVADLIPQLAPAFKPPAALRITAVHQSASAWREGRRLAQITAVRRSSRSRPPVGSTFSFSLSEQATITFSFTQRVAGRRVGARCIARTRSNARQRACKRTVTAGVLRFTGHSATNKVRFQGRLSRSRRLRSGRYTLIITAKAVAGARSAQAVLRFKIVR